VRAQAEAAEQRLAEAGRRAEAAEKAARQRKERRAAAAAAAEKAEEARSGAQAATVAAVVHAYCNLDGVWCPAAVETLEGVEVGREVGEAAEAEQGGVEGAAQ
jgi:hypothetical protein